MNGQLDDENQKQIWRKSDGVTGEFEIAHLVPEYFKIEKVEKVDEMSDEVFTCLDLHLEWNLSQSLKMSISPN